MSHVKTSERRQSLRVLPTELSNTTYLHKFMCHEIYIVNERFMLKHWMIVGISLLLGSVLSGCYSSYGIMQSEHEGETETMVMEQSRQQRSLVERLDTPAPKTQDLRLINIQPRADITDSRAPRAPGDALTINIQPPIPAPDDLDYAPEAVRRTVAEMYGGQHHGDEQHEADVVHAEEGEQDMMEGEHAEASGREEGLTSEMPISEDSLRAQVRELTAKAQELSERLENLSND